MIMNVAIYISLEFRPMLLYASTHFPGATAYSDGRFGQGTGPIVMDEVRCTSISRSVYYKVIITPL